MGNTLQRNRFWWYRSMYDDYMLREFRVAFGIAGFIFLPFYWWGVHFNREVEVNASHKNYYYDYLPRRSRLTHSLLFEQFEMCLERWMDLEDEYRARGEDMLKDEAEE